MVPLEGTSAVVTIPSTKLGVFSNEVFIETVAWVLVDGAVKSCISMLLLGIKWVVLFKSVEGVEKVSMTGKLLGIKWVALFKSVEGVEKFSMIGKLEVGRGKTVELDKGGGAVYKKK